MAAIEVSGARLRELLDYDPLTGMFTNRVRRNSRAIPGKPAGYAADKGYIHITIDGREYAAHRLAHLYMTGRWPEGEIDHRDRNPGNNVWANLRDVPRKVNAQNHAPRPSRSGYTGVSRNGSRWQVRFWLDGRQRHLGQFDCPKEAAQVAHDARCVFYPGHPVDGAEVGQAILRVLARAAQTRWGTDGAPLPR